MKSKKMNFTKGDVVLVDMGSNTEMTEKCGVRPCIVISNDIMNSMSPNMVIAPLTNANNKKNKKNDDGTYHLLPTQVFINKDEKNSLNSKSILQLEDIRSVSKNRVRSKLGKLSDEDVEKMNERLPKLFFI